MARREGDSLATVLRAHASARPDASFPVVERGAGVLAPTNKKESP